MAKITDDEKLPLGVELEVDHTHGNFAKVATALSGNIVETQREDGRSRFSLTYSLTRATGTDAAPLVWRFTLPPLQEYWPATNTLSPTAAGGGYLATTDTPTITLEALSIGFDTANTAKTIDYTNGATGHFVTALGYSNDAVLEIRKITQIHSSREHDTDPIASLSITATDLANPVNRQNPRILRDLDIVIDPFSTYQLRYVSADPNGDTALTVRLIFSHPLKTRDIQLAGSNNEYPQNAPAAIHLARDNASISLSAPAAGATIRAEGTTGVQTHIETLDQAYSDQLHAGRYDRYVHNDDPSNFAYPKENLTQDCGYFAWCVNLFKTETECDGASAIKWEENDAPGASPTDWWFFDRAIIPIVFPGTIHHVIADVGLDTLNPGIALNRRQISIGVGLGTGIKMQTKTYQQVAYHQFTPSFYGVAGGGRNIHQVPLVYSTAPATNTQGRGYVRQGRPVYFGRQIHFDATHDRQNIATAVATGAAEGAPLTGGLEQYIEVRAFYQILNAGLSAVQSAQTGAAADDFWNQAGINVYIIGKMDLAR